MKTGLLLLALFVGQPAPKTDLRFPSVTAPSVQATTKLSGSDLYVIDADIAVIATSSPLGMVKITQQAGPLTVRAKFVDSVGPELRTYKGKFVFLVEAAKTGPCELLVIPSGATKESEIIRKTIDVDAGQGPQPPPGPGPKPPPDPPSPAPIPLAGLRVLIVYETAELSKMSAGHLSIIYGADVRAFLNSICAKDSGSIKEEWRIWDKDTDTKFAPSHWQAAMKRARASVPWVIVSNGTTGFEGPLPSTKAAFLDLVKKYAGK